MNDVTHLFGTYGTHTFGLQLSQLKIGNFAMSLMPLPMASSIHLSCVHWGFLNMNLRPSISPIHQLYLAFSMCLLAPVRPEEVASRVARFFDFYKLGHRDYRFFREPRSSEQDRQPRRISGIANMKIYFVTANEKEIAESDERVRRFVERVQTQERVPLDIEICPLKRHLDELLDPNIETIVRKKAIEAYRAVHLPCVFEHGGLFLDAWPGTPGLLGGIGQIVWDAVGDRMCGFLRAEDTRRAVAQSVIGYCDGRRVRVYSGTTKGEVTEHARGDRGFRLDPIFKPTGYDLTYGEMAPEVKRETSPDEKAWELLLQAMKAEFLQARK